MRVGPQAAVGVVVRREHQRRFRHAAQQAGDRTLQHWRTLGGAVVEDVLALVVQQAEMHMHAVA